MKRTRGFGLLLITLFTALAAATACTPAAEQPAAGLQRGVTVTVYRAPT